MARNDTGLVWNEQGAICCDKHAPYKGSDTWTQERWRPMSAKDAQDFIRAVGFCECETCGQSARLIVVAK